MTLEHLNLQIRHRVQHQCTKLETRVAYVFPARGDSGARGANMSSPSRFPHTTL